jgi:uncharacterized glyoxalase superfamily protein PhnB
MLTSHVAFPLIGLASLLVGWPLAQRRVPPNRWYGVRLKATLSRPAVWYEANAVCGDGLVRLGLVLFVVALALPFVRGLPELGYVAICTAVLVVGSTRATVRGIRVVKRLTAAPPLPRKFLEEATTMPQTVPLSPAVIQMKAAVPTFLVPDVGATTRWYAEHLGFASAGTFPASEPYAYASLQRDGAELMLLRLVGYQKPDLLGRRPEGLWDAYVRMQGVQAFYEGLRSKPFIHMPLKQQPYGDWEFEVRDPNGYILVFSG